MLIYSFKRPNNRNQYFHRLITVINYVKYNILINSLHKLQQTIYII